MRLSSTSTASATRRILWLNLFVLVVGALIGWYPLLSPAADTLYTRPIFAEQNRMMDLLNYYPKVQHISGPTMGGPGATFNYPAPAAWVMAFFLHSPQPRVLYREWFAGAVLIALAIGLIALWRASGFRALLLATFVLTVACGTPLAFVQDRGNLEWVNWIFVVLAITCFCFRRYLPTALFLGLAVCVKPFPVLFFLLLFFRKKYKEIAIGLTFAVAIILAALQALGPGIKGAYLGLQPGLQDYLQGYVWALRPMPEVRFDHSLMGAVRRILYDRFAPPLASFYISIPLTSPALHRWARLDLWYQFFVIVGVAAVLAIAWFYRKQPALNSIFALTVAVLLLPFQASEYTLMLLYIPFVLFLLYLGEAHAAPDWLSCCILLLMTLLLLPLSTELAGYSGFAKCCLLLVLFVCTAVRPLPMRLFQEVLPVPAASAVKQPA